MLTKVGQLQNTNNDHTDHTGKLGCLGKTLGVAFPSSQTATKSLLPLVIADGQLRKACQNMILKHSYFALI